MNKDYYFKMKLKFFLPFCCVFALYLSGFVCIGQQSVYSDLNSNLLELTERRTVNSKTFTDGNGQYYLKQTGGYFHYKDENGNWTDIQTELSAHPEQNHIHGLFKSELPMRVNTRTGQTDMALDTDGNSIRYGMNTRLEPTDLNFQPLHTRNANSEITQADISENRILLHDFFPGIHRVQNINYWSLQTDFIITEKPVLPQGTVYLVFSDDIIMPSTWNITHGDMGKEIDAGWQGNLVITNETGKEMAQISMPKFYDSFTANTKEELSGHAAAGAYRLTRTVSGYRISMLVPAEWLLSDDLIYPVTIDPTVTNTYANSQGLEDFNTEFSSNCQATMTIALPTGTGAIVTGTSTQYTIQSKGFIEFYFWIFGHRAIGEEQRSRVGCNGNWTPVQDGVGTSDAIEDVPYNITNSTVANGCYGAGTVLTFVWQGYQIYFPQSNGPLSSIPGCVTNYQELLANTWVVTVTYTESNTTTVTANATPLTQDVCSGSSATIQMTAPAGTTYTWTAQNNNTTGASNGSGSTITQTLTATTNAAGSAVYTIIPSLNGCQGSPVIATVNVVPPITTQASAGICNGSSYSFGGNQYNTPGTYQATFQNAAGCDSTVVLTLSVVSSLSSTETVTICAGQTYTLGSNTYNTSGTYTATFQSSTGCDSTVTLHLTVAPAYNSSFNASICQGGSYLFSGYQYTLTGTYTSIMQTPAGCDSIVTMHLTVLPAPTHTISAEICQGSSYPFAGNQYSTSGSYSTILQTAGGCDSIVTLNLTVIPTVTQNIPAQICQGSSYSFAGNQYTTTGSYSTTYQTAAGCDSIVVLNLTVNPYFNTQFNQGICEGQSYTFNGTAYSTPGTYTANLLTVHGCDSIVTLSLTMNPKPEVNIGDVTDICAGQTAVLQNSTTSTGNSLWSTGSTDSQLNVTTPGVYWLRLTSPAGCIAYDSCTVRVRPVPQKIVENYFQFCTGETRTLSAENPGASYLWNTLQQTQEITVTSGGQYTVVITNEYGCQRLESIMVREYCEPSIYVPAAFTPDHDGVNDYFIAIGENIADFEMNIYNRWGERVFTTNDIEQAWNGSTDSGNYFVQDGIYHWIIYYTTYLNTGVTSDKRELKGYVTILR